MTTTNTIITSALLATAIGMGCKSRVDQPRTETPPRTKPSIEATTTDKNPALPMAPIKLTWTLKRATDGKSLELRYEIENPGDSPIFIVDDHARTTTKGLEVMPDAVAIHPGADHGTARFIAGHVPLPPGIASEVQPIAPARELPPRSMHSGTKSIPLPLKGWIDAESRAVDLSGATRATFEVTWIKPPPADREDWAWEVQKDANGKTIRTPFVGYINTMGGQATTSPIAIP